VTDDASAIRRPRRQEGGKSEPYLAASLCLASGTTVALGFARFGYGLVLPAMREDLGWSLGAAGLMTAVNGFGYLLGAVVAALFGRRWNVTRTFRAGMVVTTAALAATAFDGGYGALAVARAAAGFGGALVFVTGGVIASRIATRVGTSVPITVYFAGTGLGIASSGALVPVLVAQAPHRWPLVWLGLGAASALATLVGWGAARAAAPTHDGDLAPPSSRGVVVATNEGRPTGAGLVGVRPPGALRRTAVAYLLFATGYIAYITFLSTTLAERGTGAMPVALTWTVMGVAVMAAPRLWSRPMTGVSAGRTLALILAVLAAAAILPLAGPSLALILCSAAAYGLTFMTVPAAVTAQIRCRTPPADWPRTLAAFTIVFAVGQTGGPWAAGVIADHTSPDAPLVWTATLCAAAAAVATTIGAPRAGRSGEK